MDDAIDDMLAVASEHLGLTLTFVRPEARGGHGSGTEDGIPAGAVDPLSANGRVAETLTLPLLTGVGFLGTLVCRPRVRGPQPSASLPALRLLARLLVDLGEVRAAEMARWRAEIESTGVQALLAALEARDGYTREHSEAVVDLSARTGAELGLEGRDLDELKQVALLHDLGKIAVPDYVLCKPGALAAEEWELVRQHSVIGERIVGSVDTLSHLAPAIRAAHERWDGRGYPDGLAGEQIPLVSRIVSLCDAYDAMVSSRPYSPPIPHTTAVGKLTGAAGTQFCPTCAEVVASVA